MVQRRNVDDDISDATLQLLRTKGPRSVTVEAVTARSGIAKTTIYRRYSDRREMLSAALSRVTSPAPPVQETDARERLRWVIEHAVEAVDAGIGCGGFAALLTQEDPEFTALFRRLLAEQRAALESVIDQAWPNSRRRHAHRRDRRCLHRRAGPDRGESPTAGGSDCSTCSGPRWRVEIGVALGYRGRSTA